MALGSCRPGQHPPHLARWLRKGTAATPTEDVQWQPQMHCFHGVLIQSSLSHLDGTVRLRMPGTWKDPWTLLCDLL